MEIELHNTTAREIGQGQSPRPDVEETVVQTIGEHPLGSPGSEELSERQVALEERPEDFIAVTPTKIVPWATEVFATTQSGDSSGDDSGMPMEIDGGNFKVMQGRKAEEPVAKRVKALQSAIKQGKDIPRVVVYQDKGTGERFSPDGAHRQAAFIGLKRPVPIILICVNNARERAELESCRANTGNGLSQSNADQKYQMQKACDFFYEQTGRHPKPSQLAEMTEVSHPTCTSFLREYLAPKAPPPPEALYDEEQQAVNTKLQKIRDNLKAIKIADSWIVSEPVQATLAEIGAEVERIDRRDFPEPEVTPERLGEFQIGNNLTMQQLGRLIGVKHTSVSRWLNGKSKMTPRNMRAVRQMMALSPDQIAAILEGNGDA